jgi:hypothetical protein
MFDLAMAKLAPKKNAQDLECGDGFIFHDKVYVCLSCITDKRTTSTNVTAINQENAVLPLEEITIITFFRTYRVPVFQHYPITVSVLGVEKHEISAYDCQRLDAMMDREKDY